MGIMDLFTSQAMATYMEDVNLKNRGELFFEKYFPAKKKSGLNLSYFKGHNNLAMDLQPGAFDAAIPLRDRQDLSKVETEMPLFREEMALYERDRQDLLNLGEINMANPNSREMALAKELLDQIYDDRYALYKGAKSAQEFMRANLAVNASFTIANASNTGSYVTHTYNFDPDGTWADNNRIEVIGGKWGDYENSDPLTDCENVIQKALEKGVVITEIVMGALAFKDMCSATKIQRNMNGNNVANMIQYSRSQIKTYIEDYLNVKILVDEQNHKKTDGTVEFYYPQNCNVTFLGTPTIGKTYFGTTPEEADARNVPGTDFSLVDTGIGILVYTKMNPNFTKVTRVSEIVLPSCENIDSVYNLYWSND